MHSLKFRVMKALFRLLPALPHAVVAGSPDEEGNSVEVVRALARRMRVYWLTVEDSESLLWLISDVDGARRVRCLRRDSFLAYLAYLTASHIFFTHGLYGSPCPPAHKTVVNLWHGDGPKRRKGFATIRSSVVVSGTELWGRPRATHFEVGGKGVLVTGNPRVDQFERVTSDDSMRRLELSPDRPLVLWLPTYRTTEYRGRRLGSVRNWSDGQELSGSQDVRRMLQQVADAADGIGITLVVKPHVLDGDRFDIEGIRRITSADLRAAHTTLYQLLARTSGLITDYSSVWTDYLVLDRPCGFYCPDLESYEAERGLNIPDYPALLPGPLLQHLEHFRSFFATCLDEPAGSRAQRHRCVRQIGAETRMGATERLMAALKLS